MKKVIFSVIACVAFSGSVLSVNSEVGLKESENLNFFDAQTTAVGCSYTIWVKDRDGNVITGYSVHDPELGSIDCLRGILAEVSFMEYRYPEAEVSYEFLAT
ncbi:hypothetical protein E0W68_02975 [Flavobacterium salilacus subsp. salilacus]|uniref:hypothetical protein n=1 Tax=Flavobacterium TaxID=237 RepID=UPI001075504F|nr:MULTISPECIES: hypothetical protein [Flavobacterium]KAF2520202.1 hypothetical protein E0W68_02975 [Flavobacterium salilacus subsp. salilacus]MBE1613881.1 hypothetical protein [Flavobacterium sp. SaA2.13]